jgi:hypothetical protein
LLGTCYAFQPHALLLFLQSVSLRRDLFSGQVDLLLVQGAVALPQVRAGTIKALAELSPDRSASMPDIPSAGESGVPGLSIAGWFGFYAPKGTPPDVIAKLNAATVRALADPAMQARFAQLGPRCRRARPVDAGRPRRISKRRNGQVVADHQSRRDQRGVAASIPSS